MLKRELPRSVNAGHPDSMDSFLLACRPEPDNTIKFVVVDRDGEKAIIGNADLRSEGGGISHEQIAARYAELARESELYVFGGGKVSVNAHTRRIEIREASIAFGPSSECTIVALIRRQLIGSRYADFTVEVADLGEVECCVRDKDSIVPGKRFDAKSFLSDPSRWRGVRKIYDI
ncbi:MAG: hypothetical protein KDD64_04075 [Bdellovibrionales bacterium]|nr:hypothetical protein [Bdellovibrionales bacterium]